MTPLEIIMLLSVHCTADFSYAGVSVGSPAGRDAENRFLRQGYITGHARGDTPMKYQLTEKGNVYVQALLNLPEPVEELKWVIPKTES